MPDYSISEISDILNGKLQNRTDSSIKNLVIDSRKVIIPKNSLFFAIKGEHHNGHDFIDDLYKKGVRNFVIREDEGFNTQNYPDSNFIFVESAVNSLQRLGMWHRKNFNIPVVGITGSNGKTIIKEWLFQLLSSKRRVLRSPRSYNSQVGVSSFSLESS